MRPIPLSNPPNPWDATVREYFEDELPEVHLEVFEDATRSILSKNDSPDIGFTYSVNPYRGCLHGCAYCYARPGHEYLGLGAGTDFDRKIVVKRNAPELLRQALKKHSWRRQVLAFSGVTDCYQPLEAGYRLTRGCLEVCRDMGNPVAIITKSALVERDLDVLAELAHGPGAHVCLSIPLLDAQLARALEPLASSPERRLRALERLSAAGIRTSVNIAPVIPGLNDAEIPAILKRAKESGAQGAGMMLLRLPGPVKAVFEERLRAALPLRAERILSLVRQTRDGALYRARFGERGRGTGPLADGIQALFQKTAHRLGLVTEHFADEAGSRAAGAQERRLRPEQLRLL